MKFTEVKRFPVAANLISFLIALVVSAVFLLTPLHAVERGFFCDDLSIRYPYRPNTITVPMLVLTCFVPAVLLVMGLEMTYGLLAKRCYSAARESSSFSNGAANGVASVSIAIGASNNNSSSGDRTLPRWDGLRSGIGRGGLLAAYLLYGNCLSFSLTEVFKLSFGTLRPSFLAACRPLVPVTSLANCSAGLFVQDVVCQSPDTSLMIDMRKSFISGHASFAVYNLFFVVLYLQRRLPLCTPRMLSSLLQTLVAGYAVLVCASRIYDHYHHPPDVVGGAVLGLLTCWVTMFKICPSDIRHPPRTQTDLLNPQGTKHGTSAQGTKHGASAQGTKNGTSAQGTKQTNSLQLTAVHAK